MYGCGIFIYLYVKKYLRSAHPQLVFSHFAALAQERAI